MRVDDRAKPERRGLAARGLELRVGHRLLAALADALRGEQFNEVGAFRLPLAYQLAQLVGRTAALGQGVAGREEPRARDDAPRDRGAQVLVGERARALNRRKTGLERDDRVVHVVERRLIG